MPWITIAHILCATSVILLCMSRGIRAGDTFIPALDPEQYDDLFEKSDSEDKIVSIHDHRHHHDGQRGMNKHGVSDSNTQTSTNNPSGIKIKSTDDKHMDSIPLFDENSDVDYKLFKTDEMSQLINSNLGENDQVSAQKLKSLDNDNSDIVNNDKQSYTSLLSSSLNPSSSSLSSSLLSTNDFAATSDAEKSHRDRESEVSKVSLTQQHRPDLGHSRSEHINGAPALDKALHNSEHDDNKPTVTEHMDGFNYSENIHTNTAASARSNITNNGAGNQGQSSNVKELAMTARHLTQHSANHSTHYKAAKIQTETHPHASLPMMTGLSDTDTIHRNIGNAETTAKFTKNKFHKKKKKKKFKKKKKIGMKKKKYHKAKMEKIHQYFLKYSNISDEQQNRTRLHQVYHLLHDADLKTTSKSLTNLKDMQRERLNEIYDVYMNNSMELLKLESAMHHIGTSMLLDGHGQTEHLQVEKALKQYRDHVERMRASASRNIQLCLRDIHQQSDKVLHKLQEHLNKTKEWKFYVTDQLEEVCEYLQTDTKDTLHELKQAVIEKDEQIAALTQEVEDLHEENEKLRDDTHDISLIRETMSQISQDSEMTQTILHTMKTWLETMQQTVGDIAYPFQQITYQWKLYPFDYDNTWTDCHGPQYVKLSGYDVGHGHYVGVVLCSTSKYKIYLGDDLNGKFLNIGDRSGEGQDHCEFVNSYREARFISEVVGPTTEVDGYGRAYWGQLPYKRKIGLSHGYRSPTWYDCGIAIP